MILSCSYITYICCIIKMIRANNHSSSTLTTLNFRNATLQSLLSPPYPTPCLLHFPDTQHLLSCTHLTPQFHLSGELVAFHQSRRYHYGRWQGSLPHGLGLWRLGEAVILVQHHRGQIMEGGHVFVLLQRMNLAAILEIGEGQCWRLVQRQQVYCEQHVRRLVNRCSFDYDERYYSLVKFINNYMNNHSEDGPKITIVEEDLYRYGFEGEGLAVVFDEQTDIVSVGWHRGGKLARGAQQQHRLNLKGRRGSSSPSKVGTVYSKHSLDKDSFRNEVFNDPTIKYFQYFDSLINQKMVKYVATGLIKASKRIEKHPNSSPPAIHIHTPPREQSRKIQQPLSTESPPYYQEEDHSMSRLMGQPQLSQLDKGRLFERLPQQRKLQIMKNEIYHKLVNRGQTPYFTSQEELSRSRSRVSATANQSQYQEVSGSRFVRSPNIQSSPQLIRSNVRNSRSRKKRIFNQRSASPQGYSQNQTLNLSYSPENRSSSLSKSRRRRIFDSGISSLGKMSHYQSEPPIHLTASVDLSEGKEGIRVVEGSQTVRKVSKVCQQEDRTDGFKYQKVERSERTEKVETKMMSRRNNEVYLPRYQQFTTNPHPKTTAPYMPTNQPYRGIDNAKAIPPKTAYSVPLNPIPHKYDYLSEESLPHRPSSFHPTYF